MTRQGRALRATIPVIVLLVAAAPASGVNSGAALDGWLTILWGDPSAESGEDPQQIYVLTDDSGTSRRLELDVALRQAPGRLLQWNGQRVQVTLTPEAESLLQVSGEPVAVEGMRSLTAPSQLAAAASVSGSQPWVSILCRFKNVTAEPEDLSFFQGMYANAVGRLDHYWRELSYGAIDIIGSTAVDWKELPNSHADYVPTPGANCGHPVLGADLDALFADCTAAADPFIDFSNGGSPFQGINMMFNADLDGCAWGGSRYATLDGVTKVWRTTWEPPWGYANEGVIAHEMGHGFGLPHSNNSDGDGNPYDNPWDVMSSATGYAVPDQDYGYLGKHTIAYHKDLLGWLAAGDIFEPSVAGTYSITLDQLALASTSNYRMLRLPFGSGDSYYAVEVRDQVGDYDGELPGNAVTLYEVDPWRQQPAWLIDADDPPATYSDTEGVMWRIGEAFVDEAHQIQVVPTATSSDGFVVEISFGDFGLLFAEGFEGGDTSGWSFVSGGP